MASRIIRAVGGRVASTRPMTTATAARMKPVTSTANDFIDHSTKGKAVKGDMFPVCVALGMIGMSMGLGLITAKNQLLHSPAVRVSKKRRESLPEVDDPDLVTTESDRFINKSLFRKVAHIQDFDAIRAGISDPTRGKNLNSPRKVETLKSIGVEPGKA